jgi:hypothetical protein
MSALGCRPSKESKTLTYSNRFTQRPIPRTLKGVGETKSFGVGSVRKNA